eukprot:g1285.t1
MRHFLGTRRRRLLLLPAALLLVARAAAAIAAPPKPPPKPSLPCPNPTVDGLTYDLSSLKGKVLSFTDPRSHIKFSFGVCTTVPTGAPLCPEGDPKHSTAVFAYCSDLATNGVAVVAADPKFTPHFTTVKSKPPKGGTGNVIGLTADLPSETSVVKFVGLKYLCNAKASTPVMSVLLPATGKEPMGFNVTITTKAACGSSGGGGGGGGAGGSGNWSTLFFIFLSVSVTLYCAAGCFINMRKYGEASVWNACPHRQFWCGLPGLVIDGIAFFFSLFGVGDGTMIGSGKSGDSHHGAHYDNLNEKEGAASDPSDDSKEGYGTSAPSPLPNPYGTLSGAPVPKKKKRLGASSGRHNKEMADAFEDTDFGDV